MTTYFTSSLCKGARPRRWARAQIKDRPHNVAKLMRERSVSRFVIAPSGYGKTYLLLNYCDSVDDFEHTMWMDAASPCFLRELDKGSLASEIKKRDGVRIAVFDDVPRLSSEWADALSLAIDELLAAQIEVLVSCRPSCDAFAARQKDRASIEARDLLLNDSEVAALDVLVGDDARVPEEQLGEQGRGTEFLRRIPLLAWNAQNSEKLFAQGVADEELPDEIFAVQIMALVLGAASLSWACGRCSLSPDSLLVLRKDYPHFGISHDDDFDAVPIGIEALSKAFASRLEELAPCFGVETRDDVCCLLADVLVENDQAARACHLLALTASQKSRIRWVKAKGTLLFKVLCIEPAWRLCSGLYKLRADADGSIIEMHQAWRTYLLGDSREAAKLALKVSARSQTTSDVRAWCLLLIAHVDCGELRKSAFEALARILPKPVCGDTVARSMEPWVVVAVGVLLAQGFLGPEVFGGEGDLQGQDAMALWRKAASLAPSRDIALLSGAYLLERYPELAQDGQLAFYAEPTDEELGAIYLEAFRKISDLRVKGILAEEDSKALMNEDVCDAILCAERKLMTQQRQFGHVKHAIERRAAMQNEQGKSALLGDAASAYVPQLHVSLFGGVEVTLGGRHLDGSRFTKTKMRALLALLVMAGGREVSRDRVISALWPTAIPETARKNLYGNWSELVRMLSLPDGVCPYLHRVQGSYRIDRRYVTSDVEQVASICREMAMGRVEATRFRNLLEELDRLYQGDFVPAEMKIEAIISARRDYRNMVTETWVNSTMHFVDIGENQMAIWTARKALEHERSLEDPYFAMMRAQLSCGQREAALLTYKQCVAMLNSLYRMDPSGRMVELYRGLMETEEEF